MRTKCIIARSENFFAEVEFKLVAFLPQRFRQLRIAAVKDANLSTTGFDAFVFETLKHSIPVGSTCLSPRLESSQQIAFLLHAQSMTKVYSFYFFLWGKCKFEPWRRGDQGPFAIRRLSYPIYSVRSWCTCAGWETDPAVRPDSRPVQSPI